eukprot:m.29443 g.29443  ORF g.29443 m.29443 type:complete len:54 (+) comp9576_c1_seq1:1-162(+)
MYVCVYVCMYVFKCMCLIHEEGFVVCKHTQLQYRHFSSFNIVLLEMITVIYCG